MNRKELIRAAATRLRDAGVRKKITVPKHVFHISDDDGNSKDFIVKKSEKEITYTIEDIDFILEALLQECVDGLKRGEPVSINGFGSLGLKYRKGRKTKMVGSEDWIDISGRYVPKFDFGKELRVAAKLFELSGIGELSEEDDFDEDGDY